MTLFRAEYADKKLTLEYGHGLNIIRKEADDFSKFLEAIKNKDIAVSKFGHGDGCAEKEVQSPIYEKLEHFFKNREGNYYRINGTIKSQYSEKILEFFLESESNPTRPYDIRIYTDKQEVFEKLEKLLI